MRMISPVKFEPKIDIPDGFYLIQDSREQKPLFKLSKWVVEKGLKTGDYSIKGFENIVTIERKSISDLLGTLGQGRDRFENELDRMRDYKFRGLLIEGSENGLYKYSGWSGLHPNSLYHSLGAIECKWGLHIYYANKPKWARWWVLSRLTRMYKYLREGKDDSI